MLSPFIFGRNFKPNSFDAFIALKKLNNTSSQAPAPKLLLNIQFVNPQGFTAALGGKGNGSGGIPCNYSLLLQNIQLNKGTALNRFIKSIYEKFEEMNPVDLREIWIKSENEFQGDYVYLLKSLHEFIYKKDDISPNERANIILEIANGLRDSVFVIDQEINFYATILRILKQLGKF